MSYVNSAQELARLFDGSDLSDDVQLSYLAEGAANTIFSVLLSASSHLHNSSGKFVLRLRKDIPGLCATRTLKQQFEDFIVPLFAVDPNLLVSGPLVKVSRDTVNQANDELRALEVSGKRKPLRRGTYLPRFDVESDAILMPNLAHGPGVVVEFKPKWLVQSPSAPTGANRCRTCALNISRRAAVCTEAGASRGIGRGDSGFCPLDLLSQHEHILIKALSQIWTDHKSLPSFVRVFMVKVQPALHHLQRLQTQHGEVSHGNFLDTVKDLGIAMALRDCSVLMRVVHESEDELDIVDVKLLDLDLKSAGGGKREKWAGTEWRLIDGGWYSDESQPCQTTGIQCSIVTN